MAGAAGGGLLASAEAHHQKIRRQGSGSAADALAAGRALLEAKASSPGKGWLALLRQTTSMNPRTVQRYMLLARGVNAGVLEERELGNISFSRAYQMVVRRAVGIARRSAAQRARSGQPHARMREAADPVTQQITAFQVFRQATRAAIAAGVPLMKLERELAECIGAKVLQTGTAAKAGAGEATGAGIG